MRRRTSPAWRLITKVGIFFTMLTALAPVDIHAQTPEAVMKECQSNDTDKRLSACAKVIAADGYGSRDRLAAALDGRCWALLMKGDHGKAIADCKASISIKPSFSYAHNNLGAAYLGIGDRQNAILALNRAIELKPNFIFSRLTRARVHLETGNIDAAIKDYEAALIIEPSNQESKEAIARLTTPKLADIPVTIRPTELTPMLLRPESSSIIPTTPDGRRIALIIGNSNYRFASSLPNTRSDAQALAEALRRIGFQEVRVEIDLSRDKLLDALRMFARASEAADWAIIYYAGHGMEVGRVNYLVPVDARLETDRDVEFEAIPLERVLSAVEGARKLRLVLLDACRNNPFAATMRVTAAWRSIGRGLARVEPDSGTLVVYAAKDGQVAFDGDGLNSPFALALIRRLPTPGLEVRRLFDYVRDDVMETTSRRQQPFTYGSVPGREDFFFVSAVQPSNR